MSTESTSPSWRLFRASERGRVPLSMVLELTRRCHLHCVHCYLNETQEPNTPAKLGSMSSRELTAAEWRGVFDQLEEAGCMYLVLTGGEIFLRPDLLEIVASARERAFNVRLFTTAMHVDRAMAAELAKLGVERVEVSLYGGPETHGKVTLCGSAYERSVEGVRLLVEAGVPCTLKCPLMTVNAAEYDQVIRLAAGLGADFKFDPTVVPRNDGNKDVLALRLGAGELDRIFSDPRLVSAENVEASEHFDTTMEGFLCSAGRNAGAMDPYGNVYPCLQWLVKAGNVRERGFREIWWGSPALETIRAMRAPAGKGGCHDSGYCNNCPGLSQLENGDPLKPALVLHELQRAERCAGGGG